MKAEYLWIKDEPHGQAPSEEWIHAVMNRVRAEAAIHGQAPLRHTGHVGGLAGVAAAAAILLAFLGWMALPSDAELAWTAQTGGYVAEYLLLAGR